MTIAQWQAEVISLNGTVKIAVKWAQMKFIYFAEREQFRKSQIPQFEPVWFLEKVRGLFDR